MNRFRLNSSFSPTGDQPKAIRSLCDGLTSGKKAQVLLGITGSGKTFTMANVIEELQRPTLILAHNKTLAAQLYQEFSGFFPENAVEYFVSYYDYYQPEAYIARTDTYIEKDLSINEQVEKMRLSATRSLMERSDVIIVSSISCIYGLGSPEYYAQMLLELSVGKKVARDDILFHLVEMHYKRNDYDLMRSTFRVRGDILDIVPAYEDDIAYRILFFGDEVEKIHILDPLTGKMQGSLDHVTIYPGSHHVTPEEVRQKAIYTIEEELQERAAFFDRENRLLERQRILERTKYDLEMIKEIGFCKGIENYSRHLSQRSGGEPPPCLLDYFPKDFLFFIDESHQTLPQMHAMYNGDRSRKSALVEFGFRLPSALDNRPLKFEEVYKHFQNVIYVSATPSPFEIGEAQGDVVQQIIRPTGLLDPLIEVRGASNQVDDALEEIRKETEKGHRILVTTLTKKLAEDLSKYLLEIGVKAKYIHSDIDTLERIRIIKALRLGEFDVLVGINLLREGLDIPEVSLVVILDADKEGFLRSETALIQTCGRAARNAEGRVVMYGDKETKAMKSAIATTHARRQLQKKHNEERGITPKTVHKHLAKSLEETFGMAPEEVSEQETDANHAWTKEELEKKITDCQKAMKKAAKEFAFEEAAKFRDMIRYYQSLEIVS
ncbi:MAG: excinuclease ABC subunit UvrB [Chlamydiota bacterium]